jgi:hypothetical protein
MKNVLISMAMTGASLSAFGAGDLPIKLDAKAAQEYYLKYQSIASEVGCSGWMASGGKVIGGGMPGYQVEIISLDIIQSKSSEKSTLKITSISNDQENTRSLSFECNHQ